MTSQEIILRLLSVFLLIAINAFFVITEFAIVAVRRERINHLVLEGDKEAKTIQSLQRSLERLLSTTQLGITLSSLALGWIGENTMASLIKYAIISLPLPLRITQALTHGLAIPLAFIFIVYLQIVFGELCPKSVALLYSEQIAKFLAPASVVIGSVFNPFILILNQSTRFLLKLIGIEYTGQLWYNELTSEELQSIINTKESSGLKAEERELLNNVFEFKEVKAKEVMTHHTVINALSEVSTCQDFWEIVAKTGHSRYPIFGESLDDIQGIVDFKDLISNLPQQNFNLNIPLKELIPIQPVRFFAESILLSELLPIMQRSHLKMVIIVDEYGATSGLITIQDLINEIIGEEAENNEENQTLIKVIDEKTFIVSAQINVEELNELLKIDLPLVNEYQTLAGFLFYQWQKIPHEGEVFHFDNLELTVIKGEDTKLHEIKITVNE